MMREITFANPELLLLLVLIIPVVVWYVLKHKTSEASLQISNINGFRSAGSSLKYYLRHVLFAFRIRRLCVSHAILTPIKSVKSPMP